MTFLSHNDLKLTVGNSVAEVTHERVGHGGAELALHIHGHDLPDAPVERHLHLPDHGRGAHPLARPLFEAVAVVDAAPVDQRFLAAAELGARVALGQEARRHARGGVHLAAPAVRVAAHCHLQGGGAHPEKPGHPITL